MESVVIETLGCPLDPDLLKSLEKFSLESSHSRTPSDHSESAGEENEIKHNDLIEQLKNLSFDDVSDSKYVTSKRSNKISVINSQEKDNSGELIFVENKETEENQSSTSSLKNKELLKFVVGADTESTFCKCSNKNYETNSKKENNTEKPSFVENLEDVENQLSSLSIKNSKLLNKYYKSGSVISAGYESDSDNDEQVESVTLRERDPTRHNRPGNNKQLRTTPFSRNHSKTSKPHFNSNNSQTFGNSSPHIFCDFNISHHGYDSVSHLNSTDFERYGIVSPSIRTFHSGFPTSESVTDEAFEGMVSSLVADQIFNNVEKESFLNSCFEDLTEEEVENILKNLTDSTLDDLSSQNHVDLIEESPLHILSSKEVEKYFNNSSILNQNICVASTAKEISHPNNNQHNFQPEPDHEHSSFSKANVEETSLFSNLCEGNGILEKSGQFYSSEYLVNKPGNYSNLVCKNITSINCESLSPKTSDYIIISNEIEHEIVKLEELEERVKKGQKKVSELCREINWNVFPFDELDDKAISECINTPENKMSNKKNDSKRKNINQTSKSPYKIEKTKICWMLGTAARDKLFNSSSFCKSKWELENEEIRQQIKSGKLGTKEKKVIHVLKKNRKTKYRGTNLHYAILSESTEKIFCIVECHKECHDGINEINLRDSFNKTVLDYSKEKGMDLLSDYLEENTARVSINIE